MFCLPLWCRRVGLRTLRAAAAPVSHRPKPKKTKKAEHLGKKKGKKKRVEAPPAAAPSPGDREPESTSHRRRAREQRASARALLRVGQAASVLAGHHSRQQGATASWIDQVPAAAFTHKLPSPKAAHPLATSRPTVEGGRVIDAPAPAPDPTRDQALAERHWQAYRSPPLVPEDATKVTPLDVW